MGGSREDWLGQEKCGWVKKKIVGSREIRMAGSREGWLGQDKGGWVKRRLAG